MINKKGPKTRRNNLKFFSEINTVKEKIFPLHTQEKTDTNSNS